MLDLSISTEESNGRRSQHAFKPNAAATGCWIIGLLATYLTLSADSPEPLAAHAAIGVGLTLLVATGFEGSLPAAAAVEESDVEPLQAASAPSST